jgi:apolipoprotein D and lipocalin family protein
MLAIAMMGTMMQTQVPPVRTTDKVDLGRYAGEWFEVARIPNRFQRKCTGNVRAHYAPRDDGRIDVTNRCTTSEGEDEAKGVAKVVDRETNAKLEVRFAPAWLSWWPPVWGDYWILGLADDYTWAVVGSPDRKYLWVLSRTPVLDTSAYEQAVETARENGFDVSRLRKTPH